MERFLCLLKNKDFDWEDGDISSAAKDFFDNIFESIRFVSVFDDVLKRFSKGGNDINLLNLYILYLQSVNGI